MIMMTMNRTMENELASASIIQNLWRTCFEGRKAANRCFFDSRGSYAGGLPGEVVMGGKEVSEARNGCFELVLSRCDMVAM